MDERVEDLGRYRLRQRDHLPKLGTDSKLLANFATLHPRERICDLGCGVGVLALLLARRKAELTLDGIELNPESAALAAENLRENGLNGRIILGDLCDHRKWYPKPGPFDLVISNPPYFAPGTGEVAVGVRGTARSEGTCSLTELCTAAGWLLRTGGRFALCHRPERLADLFQALQQAGMEPKRLRLVQYSAAHPPRVVLVEAVQQGRPGLRVLPTLLLTETPRNPGN